MRAQPYQSGLFVGEQPRRQRWIVELDEDIAYHALERRVYQKSKRTDVGFAIARGKKGTRLGCDRFKILQVNQQRMLAAVAQLIHNQAILNSKTQHNIDTGFCRGAYDTFGHAIGDKTVQVMNFHNRSMQQLYCIEHAPQTIFVEAGSLPDEKEKTLARAVSALQRHIMKKITICTVILGALSFAVNADHGRGHHGKRPKGMGPMQGKMLEKMDTDKDGKVSKQEWQTHHETMFTQLDADKDGFVTKEEMKAHHQKMMAEHGKMGPGEGKGKKGKKRPKKDDNEKPE